MLNFTFIHPFNCLFFYAHLTNSFCLYKPTTSATMTTCFDGFFSAGQELTGEDKQFCEFSRLMQLYLLKFSEGHRRPVVTFKDSVGMFVHSLVAPQITVSAHARVYFCYNLGWLHVHVFGACHPYFNTNNPCSCWIIVKKCCPFMVNAERGYFKKKVFVKHFDSFIHFSKFIWNYFHFNVVFFVFQHVPNKVPDHSYMYLGFETKLPWWIYRFDGSHAPFFSQCVHIK